MLVEYLRGSPQIRIWLTDHRDDSCDIPGVVAMELVIGCRNSAELKEMRQFLGSCKLVWPEAAEFAQAHRLLLSLRLSSGIGIPDCLIAAMALKRQTRLYTFNLKHFKGVQGLDVEQPYLRA